MKDNMKEVYFDQYCASCQHVDEDEASDQCNECLNEPGRLYSHKPLNYKEKNKK